MNSSEAEKNLSFFCKSHSSFKTRLGILSLYKVDFPNWLEKILLTIEYIQLFSLTLLIHPSVSQLLDSDAKNPFIFEVAAYCLKLANPSYLLSFTHNDATTNAVLGIILGYILFKASLLSYVMYVSWFNIAPNHFLKTIWRWVFKLQGRMACCFLTSFWVRTIVMTSNESFGIQGIADRALIAISVLLIIKEYIITFLLETQLCNFMPTKEFLSSKNFDLPIITLSQKLVIQLIQLAAYNSVSVSLWVCIILNLILSLIRQYRFFTTLPLYNYKPLVYQGDLTAIVLSLNIVHFFQQILIEADYSQSTDFRFIVMLWIIIGIMSCRLSRTSIKHIYSQLLTSYQPQGNANLLLHKVFATKYLLSATKIPTNSTEKTDLNHLLGVTQTLNLAQVFNLKSKKTSSSSYDLMTIGKDEAPKIILEYLENLSQQFPRNHLIKFNLAFESYKSTKYPSKIIKITSKLNENYFSPYQMSSALLLYDLELSTINEFNTSEEDQSIDLINYMDHQVAMQTLRIDILKQITLRKQICENIIGEKANLETIYQNAQVVHQLRTSIQKKINTFLKRAPEYYLHPLLIFAECSLYLNYSIEDYHNYYENFARKLMKFAKEFEVTTLSEENLYQDENAFLIISTDKLENNCVLYATKSFQDICGADRNNYINTPLTRLFPPCLRDYYGKIFKEIFEKGHTEFTNQSIRAYLSHKEGWLIEADIFIKVHPYMSQNLYLDLFVRPHRSLHDAILLDETGKIEGATPTISQIFGINKLANTSLHIKQYSEELSNLNAAFNIVNSKNGEVNLNNNRKNPPTSAKFKTPLPSPETPPAMDYSQALEIYNNYNEDHKLINFKAEKIDDKTQTFKCSISTLEFKTFSLNFIRLENIFQKIKSGDFVDNSVSIEESLPNLGELQERKQIDCLPGVSVANSIQTKDDHRSSNTHYDDTDENLVHLSPTSSRQFLKNTLLLSSHRAKTTQRTSKFNPAPGLIPTSHNFSKMERRALSVGSHASSKISQISGVFKSFQRALTTRSHQRSFNFLCLIFYGVILGTLICQIVLKSVLDTTMDRLITKTNLLNYAQRRTLQICSIHNNARGCKLTIDGLLVGSDLQVADSSLRNSLANMDVPEQILTQSNTGIANNIASEDDEIKQMLFEKDITIIGNLIEPTDTNTQIITHFQHGDVIRNTVRYLNGLPLVASSAGGNAFSFILNNAAKDFLVKNNAIIDMFQASVDNQKSSLQVMINLSVIVLPILLAGIVCLLAVIIFKQYRKEKQHLLAFLKLNPAMIQYILENLKVFENRLIKHEKLEDKLVPKLIYRLENATQFTSYHKTHDSQVVSYYNMQKRYFLYIFKVLFYITLLIAIVILNYVLITKAVDEIYRKQRQVNFANTIGSTCAVTYNGFTEAFVTNNTNTIMGQPPFEIMTSGLKNVSQIQEEIYSEFQLEDGTYDPDVKSILFDEVDCSLFTAASWETCTSLAGYGIPNNLVSTIKLYKDMLDQKYTAYLANYKVSNIALLLAALSKSSYILAGYRVSASSAQLLSEIISAKLTHSVDDIYDLGTTILVIFSVILLIVSILIWFQILTKVKRVNDDFKKVLAVLPPNIILSSFLLKSFLNKTSNITQKL